MSIDVTSGCATGIVMLKILYVKLSSIVQFVRVSRVIFFISEMKMIQNGQGLALGRFDMFSGSQLLHIKKNIFPQKVFKRSLKNTYNIITSNEIGKESKIM